MKLKITHPKLNICLGEDVIVAKTFFKRLKGLMFINEMNGFDGLMIERCNSIHNFFVRFPIDVIFLDKNNNIVKILRNFRPWKISWIYFKACKTLELPVGKVPLSIKEGEKLEVKYV